MRTPVKVLWILAVVLFGVASIIIHYRLKIVLAGRWIGHDRRAGIH